MLGDWITDNYNWRWIFFINVPVGILSLYLSNKLIKDPPAFTAERLAAKQQGRLPIDGLGITLIALASAALEIALDRGQIDDWFNDRFITTMIVAAVFGWIATIAWELYVKDPIIDFSLLRSRNFAIATILLFVFGISLFGTTNLIPQMLQSLYGYRAIDAGLVLGPGAFVITLLAPVSAQLLQRRIVSPKTLLFASMSIVGVAMFAYSSMNLDTNASHYRWERMLQASGYGLFLVPVNIIAYSQLRPDQNNKASSLTNLFRNWGGSFGIAFVTTESMRRQAFHQSNLASHLDAGSQVIQQLGKATAGYLMQLGFTKADASAGVLGVVYEQIGRQSLFLAFMDCFRVIGWITLAMIPLVLAIRSIKGVHGGFVDGSGWEGVYKALKKEGYTVSVVQNPTISLTDDVAVTKRAIAALDGPVILVGHSYGGAVITEAGNDPKVVGLVYITAFALDKGESVSSFIKDPPPGAPVPPIMPPQDGFLMLDKQKFPAAFAGDVAPEVASFMADSQVPWGLDALGGTITQAAWRAKPSWYLVTTEDKMIPPDAQRMMSKRAGSTVIEVKGSHAIYVSQPRAVAHLIEQAAAGAFANK